eukprot:gene23235-28120_t
MRDVRPWLLSSPDSAGGTARAVLGHLKTPDQSSPSSSGRYTVVSTENAAEYVQQWSTSFAGKLSKGAQQYWGQRRQRRVLLVWGAAAAQASKVYAAMGRALDRRRLAALTSVWRWWAGYCTRMANARGLQRVLKVVAAGRQLHAWFCHVAEAHARRMRGQRADVLWRRGLCRRMLRQMHVAAREKVRGARLQSSLAAATASWHILAVQAAA